MKARGVQVLVLLVAAALTCGCSRTDRASLPATATDAAPSLDVETMAFLSKARALHHEANLKEEQGDTRGAAAVVERIVHAGRPHPAQTVPEVDEVLADAWARLAELDVRLGDANAGVEAARQGLSYAREPTYFRGHLLEVEGIAQEARSAALGDAGDVSGATDARTAAMRLLEEAVGVQSRVIAEALDAGDLERGTGHE